MLKLHFFNWGAAELNIEAALGIAEDVDDFLRAHVPGLELEATDNAADMEDNQIYWFSCPDEERALRAMTELLDARLGADGPARYGISREPGLK